MILKVVTACVAITLSQKDLAFARTADPGALPRLDWVLSALEWCHRHLILNETEYKLQNNNRYKMKSIRRACLYSAFELFHIYSYTLLLLLLISFF